MLTCIAPGLEKVCFTAFQVDEFPILYNTRKIQQASMIDSLLSHLFTERYELSSSSQNHPKHTTAIPLYFRVFSIFGELSKIFLIKLLSHHIKQTLFFRPKQLVMGGLESLFEVDWLLPRTILASLSHEHILNVLRWDKMPPEAVLAMVFYHLDQGTPNRQVINR